MRFIILLFLFVNCSSSLTQGQEYQMVDYCSQEPLGILITFDENLNNSLKVSLMAGNKISDYVEYEGLSWRETKEIVNDTWLIIQMPLKGGMGIHWERTVFLQICNGNLYESMNVVTSELVSTNSNVKVEETYSIDIDHSNVQNQKLILSESYLLDSPSYGVDQWDNHQFVEFLDEEHVFFSERINIINAEIFESGELINGFYPSVKLKRYTYVFIKGNWFTLDDENFLSR